MENKSKNENNLLALISYLGFLFIIPYFCNKNSEFVKYHAKQGRNLFITEIVIYMFLIIILPSFSDYSSLLDYIKSLNYTNILIICLSIILFGVSKIIGMINALRGNKKHLPHIEDTTELTKCICVIVSMFIVPSLINLFISSIIENNAISGLISNFIYILALILLYKNDLIEELKIFKENFSFSIKTGLKYYIVGYIGMVVCNLIVNLIAGNIGENETLVRETMFQMPIYSLISMAIIAPLSEEIVFRKSLRGLFQNKWFYAITCGVLFGLAHVITHDFTLSKLIFILPYTSLGFFFGMAYYETKSIYTPMVIHGAHNTLMFILLNIFNSLGVV